MTSDAAYYLACALKLAGDKYGVAFNEIVFALPRRDRTIDPEKFVAGLVK